MSKTPDLNENLAHLSNQVRAAEVKLAEAREARDQLIRKQVAYNERTMYAIAKITGITQAGVRKIVNK